MQNKLKILYVTNGLSGPGGLERVLSIKLHYLIENFGYEIHVITLNQDTSELFYKFNKRITHHNITTAGKLNYLYIYATSLRTLVKKINPDIISVCDDGLKGFFLPYILGKSCPMIYERHASKNIFKTSDSPNYWQKIKFNILNKIMHFGGRKFDAFIVLTSENLNEWHLKNLKVLPNPLSFYPKEKAKLINKKVISVGNHGFQKGYDRLLQSWKLVIDEHPDWHLEIYGKIDKDKKHIKLAKELNIADNILFFNPVKNIQDKYKEASIYAMSSRSEGFGMVLIEAMAYGIPCVSYNCPCGPKDIITNNEDGFLVENGNIDFFAQKIISLIENETLRHQMGSKAREKASLYFPDHIVNKWDRLFKELTSKI